MYKRKITFLFSMVFIFAYVQLSKNSNLRGTKRFIFALQFACITVFGWLEPAKPHEPTPQKVKVQRFGVEGFTPQAKRRPNRFKPPGAPNGFRSSQPLVENQGLFGGATGFGGNDSGSSGDNSNLSSKSPGKCEDPDPFHPVERKDKDKKDKKKKKKDSDEISKEKVIEEYQNFLSKMKEKGHKVNISEDRFLELSKNPQTELYSGKALFEAEGGLELELSGTIKNLRRPDNSKVDLDFMAESVSSGKTIFIDHKGMIDFASLAEKGIDISNYPDHESVAFNMGRESVRQKKRFIGLDQGPVSMSDVVHLYNFEKIRNKAEVPLLMQAVLNGTEQAGYTDGVIFLNYE